MKELIGKPVAFIPCFLYKKEFQKMDADIQPVRGVIAEVSPHGWFRCKYTAGNTVQHECFKLVDIGRDVTLIGKRG